MSPPLTAEEQGGTTKRCVAGSVGLGGRTPYKEPAAESEGSGGSALDNSGRAESNGAFYSLNIFKLTH